MRFEITNESVIMVKLFLQQLYLLLIIVSHCTTIESTYNYLNSLLIFTVILIAVAFVPLLTLSQSLFLLDFKLHFNEDGQDDVSNWLSWNIDRDTLHSETALSSWLCISFRYPLRHLALHLDYNDRHFRTFWSGHAGICCMWRVTSACLPFLSLVCVSQMCYDMQIREYEVCIYYFIINVLHDLRGLWGHRRGGDITEGQHTHVREAWLCHTISLTPSQ